MRKSSSKKTVLFYCFLWLMIPGEIPVAAKKARIFVVAELSFSFFWDRFESLE